MKSNLLYLFVTYFFVTGYLFGENIPTNDVRFYNLEKEYRQTNTWIYNVKNADPLEMKQIIGQMLSIGAFLT